MGSNRIKDYNYSTFMAHGFSDERISLNIKVLLVRLHLRIHPKRLIRFEYIIMYSDAEKVLVTSTVQ